MTKTLNARFPGTCGQCQCEFPTGTLIRWDSATRRTYHLSSHECAVAQAKSAGTPKPTLDLKPLAEFLQAARARGLKWPALRVLDVTGSGELRLSLNGSGAVVVKDERGGYFGRVWPNGAVDGYALTSDDRMQAHLVAIAADPAAFAKAYAVLKCRCSFCAISLTDEGSIEVGYGPICAKHWGLPHKPKGSRAPVAATWTQREIDDNDAAMDAMVRAGELAENARVAEYKFNRDAR